MCENDFPEINTAGGASSNICLYDPE